MNYLRSYKRLIYLRRYSIYVDKMNAREEKGKQIAQTKLIGERKNG